MVKTLQGWYNSGVRCYDDYVRPGDIVDEATVDYFRDTVPPHMMGRDYLQYGEAWDIAMGADGYNHETWTTFYRKDGVWYYAGHCFTGKIENKD